MGDGRKQQPLQLPLGIEKHVLKQILTPELAAVLDGMGMSDHQALHVLAAPCPVWTRMLLTESLVNPPSGVPGFTVGMKQLGESSP